MRGKARRRKSETDATGVCRKKGHARANPEIGFKIDEHV